MRDRTGRSSPGLPVLRVAWAVFPACLSWAGCAGSDRDVVPVSRDVVTDRPAAGRADQGYEYVARRPLAVVALAEARGIESVTARAAIDRLADRLDACVTEEGRKGTPVEGAARVVAQIGASGEVSGTNVRLDPGTSGAASAVLCLVAPMKLLAFPSADNDARGMAIEAIWGRVSTP